MRTRFLKPATLILAGFVLMLGFVAGAPSIFAQATPSADTAHPAHIHSGTCAELGDVVFPLEDVSAANVDTAPAATAEMGDAAMDATPGAMDTGVEGKVVAESTTDVEASLEDIMGAEHAVNVHESAENIGNYIACGDITGEMMDGTLTVELQELNGSGYSGEAVLTDNGDGTTTVIVTLMQMDGMATPEASPMS
jgi:hypothetical protein